MRAGVVTLWGLSNFGNRLQNYAVCASLQKLGVYCETLVPAQWGKTHYRNRLEAQAKKLYARDPVQAQLEKPQIVREFRFCEFNESYVPSRKLDCVRFSDSLAREYDVFVTGSDQVWNPRFRDSLGQLENRLLSFAPNGKRVCFAPSFGIDELESKWHDLFYKELFRFQHLNVREQSGAEIIRQLTGRDAQVVLDPTFMVEKDEWVSLSKPLPGFDVEQPYVLHYFLGNEEEEIPAETRGILKREIAERGLKEYRLFDKNDPTICSAGPSEFLWLLSHASLICTDSFHGTVFSILLGKPFLLCERKLIISDKVVDMSNRTISLLHKLEIPHKLPGMIPNAESIWEADYGHAYEIIAKEQERMNGLLREAMRLE